MKKDGSQVLAIKVETDWGTVNDLTILDRLGIDLSAWFTHVSHGQSLFVAYQSVETDRIQMINMQTCIVIGTRGYDNQNA